MENKQRSISIRLPEDLIQEYIVLSEKMGLGYQAVMKFALYEFLNKGCEDGKEDIRK